ncbi:MAG: SIMPL domain-containing protein [Dehalococcoidia bacterium]|jgi:hypothetical protein|nr:SIMPL domain-containing protein [Dehalococcoidia bacterium]
MGRPRLAAIVLTAIILAAIALLAVGCSDGATEITVSQPSQSGISVSGSGSVTVVPDIAVITIGVEVTAPNVAAARSEAAASMGAVLASFEANAVPSADIRTLSFSIQPQYLYQRDEQPEITGYTVTNRVSVKVRDLDTVSDVLDDAAEAGGDAVRINNISFTVDNPEQFEAEAREAAVADAQARAETLATLAGVTLGKVRSISESGVSMPFAERSFGGGVMQAAAAAPPSPISPGETEISLSVFVEYEIE